MEQDYRQFFETAILGFDMRYPELAASLRNLSMSEENLRHLEKIYRQDPAIEIAINLRMLKYAPRKGAKAKKYAQARLDAWDKILNFSLKLYDGDIAAYQNFKDVAIEFLDDAPPDQRYIGRMFSAIEEMKESIGFPPYNPT